MFVGRTKELQRLNERYNSGEFECVAIYGRRRVGKTELIKEFIKGKKAIFFTALEDEYEANLDAFSTAVFEALNDGQVEISFKSIDDLFSHVHKAAQKEHLILAIDEYPYLAQSKKAVSSVLQRDIDHKFKNTNIFIILCGSSMSFMEHQVMGYKSPLYGRRTGQFKILPFDYTTSKAFYKNFTDEECAVIYGITGGIPKYLTLFDDGRSLEENIVKNYFATDSILFEEPSNLLKQELREPAAYNSIITAIATGSSKLSEIATKVGMESGACCTYINSLMDLGIVKKELPVMSKPNAKNSIYRLSDGMFRFWYRFVYKNLSNVQLDRGEEVYGRIKEQIPAFMGETFEDICRQYMHNLNATNGLPMRFFEIGRWWGNNPLKKEQQEIDLLAVNQEENSAIFAECKWTNEPMPESVIDDLMEKAKMFKGYFPKYYYFFSKSGFAPACKKRADEHIILVEFGDMNM
ncbi:MAG: ATP-binding protein [Oscillospiraceae bacterium]|nr:ATP-binding protein [Oscillospiraceae bacterium]